MSGAVAVITGNDIVLMELQFPNKLHEQKTNQVSLRNKYRNSI